MVEFVDLLVERWCVQGSVEPVVPRVFEDEEDGDLVGHGQEGGERHRRRQAAVLC